MPQSALVVFAGVEKVLVVEDGKAHEQRVRTGRRVGDRVEISTASPAGDLVIIVARAAWPTAPPCRVAE